MLLLYYLQDVLIVDLKVESLLSWGRMITQLGSLSQLGSRSRCQLSLLLLWLLPKGMEKNQ